MTIGQFLLASLDRTWCSLVLGLIRQTHQLRTQMSLLALAIAYLGSLRRRSSRLHQPGKHRIAVLDHLVNRLGLELPVVLLPLEPLVLEVQRR